MVYTFLQIALHVLLAVTATAAPDFGQVLRAGEGISSPTNALVLVGENPAGLIYTKSFHGALSAYQFEDTSDNNSRKSRYGIMAASGNGQIAAGAAGLLNQGEVRLGLAFNEDSSDLAAGISAVRFNDDGDKDDMDIGLLFGAKKTVTYGLTVYDVFGRHSRGLRKFAFGVAGDQSSSITFLADFLSYINSNDGNKFYGYFTPGIRLLFDRFHLSFSSRMYTGPSDYEQAALKPKSLTLLGIGYVFNSGDSLQIMNNYLGDIGIAYNMNFQKEYE